MQNCWRVGRCKYGLLEATVEAAILFKRRNTIVFVYELVSVFFSLVCYRTSAKEVVSRLGLAGSLYVSRVTEIMKSS